MNVNELRSRMVLKNLNERKLAEMLQVSKNTMSSRMTGRRPFTLKEIRRICEILEISDDEAAKIFLV